MYLGSSGWTTRRLLAGSPSRSGTSATPTPSRSGGATPSTSRRKSAGESSGTRATRCMWRRWSGATGSSERSSPRETVGTEGQSRSPRTGTTSDQAEPKPEGRRCPALRANAAPGSHVMWLLDNLLEAGRSWPRPASSAGSGFWVDAVPCGHAHGAVALGSTEDHLAQRHVPGPAQLVELVQWVGHHLDVVGAVRQVGDVKSLARLKLVVSVAPANGHVLPHPQRPGRSALAAEAYEGRLP